MRMFNWETRRHGDAKIMALKHWEDSQEKENQTSDQYTGVTQPMLCLEEESSSFRLMLGYNVEGLMNFESHHFATAIETLDLGMINGC